VRRPFWLEPYFLKTVLLWYRLSRRTGSTKSSALEIMLIKRLTRLFQKIICDAPETFVLLMCIWVCKFRSPVSTARGFTDTALKINQKNIRRCPLLYAPNGKGVMKEVLYMGCQANGFDDAFSTLIEEHIWSQVQQNCQHWVLWCQNETPEMTISKLW